jgi:K+-transporting ATPase KdpF subunit
VTLAPVLAASTRYDNVLGLVLGVMLVGLLVAALLRPDRFG